MLNPYLFSLAYLLPSEGPPQRDVALLQDRCRRCSFPEPHLTFHMRDGLLGNDKEEAAPDA